MLFKMKKLLFWCAVLGLALASCGKKEGEQTATPAPEHVAPATPEPHLIATGGVFFLVEKATLETSSGIFNYRPGTKVHRVGSGYLTSDGRKLTLRADQVTNNLQKAQQAAGNDAAAQAQIQAATKTARALQPLPPSAGATPGSK
jgi:hypothetical protein